jgi:hypothetical protein
MLREKSMKLSRLLLILACFSIFYVPFSGVVSALEQDEARVTPIWQPTETPTPDSVVTLTIFFINDYSEPLTIQRVGVHIDWMEEEKFVGHDLSDDPVIVPTSGGHYFPPITITVPQDVSAGIHDYFIGVDGILVNSTTFTWDSSTRALQIQDSGEDGTNGGNGGDGDTSSDVQQNPLLIIVGVAVVVGVAAVIMILLFRRKKTSNRTANHLTEP